MNQLAAEFSLNPFMVNSIPFYAIIRQRCN